MSGSKRIFLTFVITCTLLPFLLLGITLIPGSSDISSKLPISNKVLTTITHDAFLNASVVQDISWFLAATLLLHILLGLFLYLLYRPVLKKWPAKASTHIMGGILFIITVVFWLIQINSTLYPNSNYSHEAYKLNSVSSIAIWIIISIFMLSLTSVNALYLYKKTSLYIKLMRQKSRRKIISFGSILLICTVAVYFNLLDSPVLAKTTALSPNQPNVIIIGIDSLRADHRDSENAFLTPHLNEYLKQASVFQNATTPLARTFPAWMSILTGKYPVNSGARVNLISPENLLLKNSINNQLKEHGYKTIYAIDERRFNNIDDKYGFDKIIGPDTGISDFILGSINDLPLNNLTDHFSFARYLFPYTHNNRAAVTTYYPDSFREEISSVLDKHNGGPLFLNIHLCLPHWPYIYANSTATGSSYKSYLNTLARVDLQFGGIISDLKKRNILDNSLVFVMSDHGESFNLDDDTIHHYKFQGEEEISIQTDITSGNIIPSHRGHGDSMPNKSQNGILFSFRDFRQERGPETINTHVSLVDIAPTILDSLSIPYSKNDYDGITLLPYLKEPSRPEKRFFFLESGFTLNALKNPNVFNTKQIISEGITYYNINKDGRLTIKNKALPGIIATKQRVVLFEDWALAFVSKNSPPLLINQKEKKFWRMHEFSETTAPTQEMLNALCSHYERDKVFQDNVCKKNLL